MDKKLPDWLIVKIPEYENSEYLEQAFEDSTHHLWRLEKSKGDNENHFLKICHQTNSPFWEVTQELFDFELKSEIANFSGIYDFISRACSLEIPILIKAETLENNHAYVLTSELNGNAIETQVSDEMVRMLAIHLAELHSNSSDTWGSFNQPKFKPSDWPNRLETVLLRSDKKWGGVFLESDKYLKQAVESCSAIDANSFVPMMADLRWDQFLQTNNVMTALVDLDAFVFAPRELDFVILEYLLSPAQISVFSEVYSTYHELPQIESVRPAYRLLLFYMQILGEQDLDAWMNSEVFFD